jgi:glycosyltransferase involved in cell wall biosynthesis
MLRIGFDGRYINDRYHGIGRVASSLLHAMLDIEGDHRFVVFLGAHDLDSRFDIGRLASDPRVEIVPIGLPLLIPSEHALWPRLIRRHRLDVMHSPYVVGPLISTVPVVVTVHDLIFELHPEYTPRRVLRIAYRAMASASLARASAVIAVSEATRQDLEAWYPATRGRTQVIPNGVAATFSRVTDPARLADVKARYALPPRFVLAVGAGRPHKNLDVLVEAADELKADSIGVVIASAPDPRFRDTVGELIAARGLEKDVTRIQQVREDDMAALYTLADVFVFPSFIEGFGLPMLEAMAAGTPVVASDIPVVREVGRDAILVFDPTDRDALSTQIRRVDREPGLRSALTMAGLERTAYFSWDRAARSTLELYRSLVKRPAVHGVTDE